MKPEPRHDSLGWECLDKDCRAKFLQPRRLTKGRDAGTLICPECAGTNIREIQA